MLRSIFVLTSFTALVSCNNYSSDELIVYNTLNAGMEKSIKSIMYQSDLVYKEFENKKTDPVTASQAKRWTVIMDSIKGLSSNLVKYIHGLKYDIDPVGSKDEDVNVVAQIFVRGGKAKELFRKLNEYKNSMLNIHENFGRIFQSNDISVLQTDTTEELFLKNNFSGKPLLVAKCILNKYESDVRIMEGSIAAFVNNNITNDILHFDSFSTLIGQSSSIVKKGEKIKIQAGVGAFSSASNPTILIDGKSLKPQDGNGYVECDFKTPHKAGKYSKKVSIEFTKEDGTKQKNSYNIEYTVKE